MTTDRDQLREALGIAAFTFETYAKLHSEKGTPDGFEKAAKNAALAERMRAALATTPGKRPWCETCGKDVDEVLCPVCAKWWNDNPPPVEPTTPDQAVMDERERCARIAELWRDENKAAAAKARKREKMHGIGGYESPQLADQLEGAAIECNAIAAAIRAQGEPK